MKNSHPTTAEIQPYIDQGLVSRGLSPGGRLAIYNYTDSCQRAKLWNEVTRACRGLLLDHQTGRLVALPFQKFYNIDELPETTWSALPWDHKFAILEKYDGALGIIFFDPHVERWDIATRRSFSSPQAQYARKTLLPKLFLNRLNRGFTYLAEIIMKRDPLGVLRYDWEGLVLIGCREHESGDLAWPESLPEVARQIGAVVPEVYTRPREIESFFADIRTGPKMREGVVVTFEGGKMVKFKTDQYRLLIRASRWLSQNDTIAAVAQGREGDLVRSAPTDCLDIVSDRINELVRLRERLLAAARRSYDQIKEIRDRKAFALAVQERVPSPQKHFMFYLRSNQDLSRCLRSELAKASPYSRDWALDV